MQLKFVISYPITNINEKRNKISVILKKNKFNFNTIRERERNRTIFIYYLRNNRDHNLLGSKLDKFMIKIEMNSQDINYS